jgi:DnaJ-class molecular chaperone
MKKNFHKVLGVNQKAGPEKIKRAYRQAAKLYHPDVSPRNERKFKEIQEAYETLSDPEKKAIYDREFLERRASTQSPKHYHSHPLQSYPSSVFDEIVPFFGRFEDFWMDRWSDFFGEREQSHTDLSVEITLTPSEARRGCEIPLKMPFGADCRRCQGTGYVKGLICGLCRGSGKEKNEKKITITIPSGVKSGMRIRIPLGDPDLKRIDLVATLRVSR